MTDRIKITKPQDSPEILITAEDADRMTGGGYGPTVAEIDVINKDGTYSRFFITIGINKRNQAVCEVCTNRNDLMTNTRKTVTAMRRDPITDHPTLERQEAWYLEDHPPSPPTAPPLCVQKLILAAESILANACESGSYGPDSHGGLDDAEMADYPRDEDGDVWFDDFWTLKEALAACMHLVE